MDTRKLQKTILISVVIVFVITLARVNFEISSNKYEYDNTQLYAPANTISLEEYLYDNRSITIVSNDFKVIKLANKTPIYFSNDYDINATLNFINSNQLAYNLILTVNISEIGFGFIKCPPNSGGCYNLNKNDIYIQGDIKDGSEYWRYAFFHELGHGYYFNNLTAEKLSEWAVLYEQTVQNYTKTKRELERNRVSVLVTRTNVNDTCSAITKYACTNNEEYYADYFSKYINGERFGGRQEELIRQDVIDLIGHDIEPLSIAIAESFNITIIQYAESFNITIIQ